MAAPTRVRYDADPCRSDGTSTRSAVAEPSDLVGRHIADRSTGDGELGRRGPDRAWTRGRRARWRCGGRVSSASSSTPTAAPAMAKSPWRRAISRTAKPHRPVHTGQRIPDEQLVGLERRAPEPGEEVGGGDRPAGPEARWPPARRRAPSATAGYSRGGVGVGDRAADRASVADLEVPDERRGAGQERHRGRDLGVGLRPRPPSCRPRPTARRPAARCPSAPPPG